MSASTAGPTTPSTPTAASARAARDGKTYEPGLIPDGFYLVTDTENLRLEFQQAIIRAVEAVTPIAPPDAAGEIIGCPVLSPGVIAYPQAAYGMCAAITGAPYTTTTEVYPDSPQATPRHVSIDPGIGLTTPAIRPGGSRRSGTCDGRRRVPAAGCTGDGTAGRTGTDRARCHRNHVRRTPAAVRR